MAMGLGAHQCTTHISHTIVSPQARAPRAATPAWIGVCVGTDERGGALVDRVNPGSPGAQAGLRRGDLIVGFTASGPARLADDIHTSGELVRLVQSYEPGEHAAIIFRRDGELHTARLTLGQMPQRIFDQGPYCSRRSRR
jgi:S1-C subfamily serine protease